MLIRRCQTGETTARPQCCHVPAKLSDYHAAIREQVAARPDATLAELRTWLVQTHQVSVSVTLMWETLAQLRLTLKKDSARGRTEPRGYRQGAWRIRLVFYEEGAFSPGGFIHLACGDPYFGTADIVEHVLHFSSALAQEEREALRSAFVTPA